MEDDYKKNWERPTQPNRDIHRQQGMIMAEVQKLSQTVDDLEGRILILEDQTRAVIPRMRASIRAPHVQSGGIAFTVSSTLIVIFETLRAIGVIH